MTQNRPLFDVKVPEYHPGPIETAADASIKSLQEHEHLTEAHTLIVQMIRSLARACDRGLDAPKVSVATTTMLRQLGDLMLTLPGTEIVADDQATADLMAALEDLRNA